VLRLFAFDSSATLAAPVLRTLVARAGPYLSGGLSAAGALCGIAGTGLLAIDPSQVTAVFVLYLGAASAWMSVGYLTQQRWLFLSNIVYFLLALKGLAL
jgi:hypothetical protein